MTRLAELVIGAVPEAWRAAGFAVAATGECTIGTVVLRLDPSATGITSWVLAGAPDEETRAVDGLTTRHGDAAAPVAAAHPIGATLIDHLVVMTPDIDRTVAAVERELGLPVRRRRDGPSGSGQAVRQAFFRMGEVILEVVAPAAGPGPGPASFWGLTLTVASLDAAVALLGPDRVSPPKPAVQPGRRIATVREAVGLGVPVALMDPPPGR